MSAIRSTTAPVEALSDQFIQSAISAAVDRQQVEVEPALAADPESRNSLKLRGW